MFKNINKEDIKKINKSVYVNCEIGRHCEFVRLEDIVSSDYALTENEFHALTI